jgi:nucleotide-binding universal stress UspA family protein
MTPFQRIAVGFDGSLGAETAVRWSFELAQQVGAEVIVIHAIGLLEHTAGADLAAGLELTVKRLAREAAFDLSRVRWHLTESDPCTALAGAARAPIAADLVVVGSRGHGVRAGLLLGSTSHEVAEHSVVPIVVVPPRNDETSPASER